MKRAAAVLAAALVVAGALLVRSLNAKAPKAASEEAAASIAGQVCDPVDVPSSCLSEWTGREAAKVYLQIARATRQDGAVEQALVEYAIAADVAHAASDGQTETIARFVRAFDLARRLFRFDEAERELNRVEPLVANDPSNAAYLAYYRALVHSSAGDLTSAVALLRQARQRAEALKLEGLVYMVADRQAAAAQALGDLDGALRRFARQLERSTDPCQEAQAAINLGWTLILMRERGLSAPPDMTPEAPLRRSLELFSGECEDDEGVTIARVNLAFAALGRGEPDSAQKQLETVARQTRSGRVVPWIMEARTRVALAHGDLSAAQEHVGELIRTANAVAESDTLFRAHVLSAEVLTRLGRTSEALAARQHAELTLDRLAGSVPLIGARHMFLAARDENIRGLIDLLLARARPDPALAAIRRARSRSLGWARVSQGLARLSPARRSRWNVLLGEYRRIRRTLDESEADDWRLAASELETVRERRMADEARLVEVLDEALALLPSRPEAPTAEPGVLRLAWLRSLDGDVHVVGQLGKDTFAVPWTQTSSTVPAAVARRLARAKRVLLHPYGDLRGVDLHMLTWRSRPMAALVPTAYALDLPTSGAVPEAQTALVVVDPAGELARAKSELQLVQRALTKAGTAVTAHGGDVAGVRQQLERVDWFHFGGHGYWSPDEPMAGGLALADGARLGIGDILAAPRVPATVVLTSCEAGRGAERGGEAFGLAHAFLVAGSRVVLAPNREVSDDEATTLAQAFYSATGSAFERYRAAIDRLGGAASAFRIFVP